MSSLVELFSVDLIFILKYIYINFCVTFLYCKKQSFLLAILGVILSWSRKYILANVDTFDEKKYKYLLHDFSSLFG